MKMLKRRQLKVQQEKTNKRRRTGVLVAAAAAFTVLAVTYFLSPSTHKVESLRQDAPQEQSQQKTVQEQRSETRPRFFSDLIKLRVQSLMLLINAGLNYNPLLSELKNEYPYKSLDCRFTPFSKDILQKNQALHDENAKIDFDGPFVRRLDEIENLAKEKNIMALVSIIDFLDSLNIEAVGGGEFSPYLDEELVWMAFEASKTSGHRMLLDYGCWDRVREARHYLGYARDCLIEIVVGNPSSMATVLFQLPERQRPFFLLDIAKDLHYRLTDEAPNLHDFESIYLSLPQRERKQVEEALFNRLSLWIDEDAKYLASLPSDTIANLNTQTRNLLERLFRRLKVGKHH